MRIAILTQYYPPEVGAPQRRLSFLARLLVRRGHGVWVLTAMPNYPSGRIFPGYGGWLRRERMDGVTILRSFIYASNSLSFLPRMASYLSFVASSVMNGLWALPGLDILIVESPPLFLAISGFALSTAKGARLVFNVSDLWPASALELGVIRRGLSYRLASLLERFAYKNADLVSGQSRGIVEDIQSRQPKARVCLFSNSVDTADFSPEKRSESLRREYAGPDEMLVTYAGLHGLAQGLHQVLDTAADLGRDSGVRFLLVGDGPEKADLMARARAERLSHVTFRPAVAAAEVPVLLASSDVILVPLRTALTGAVPSKLYEAMASGRPVVVSADGEAKRIVTDAGCGIAVVPGDSKGLSEAIRTLKANPALRDEMGLRGRKAAETLYDRERVTERFIDELEELVLEKRS
jgi:glycosyltransferase involved in cell wall biosynthesis